MHAVCMRRLAVLADAAARLLLQPAMQLSCALLKPHRTRCKTLGALYL